MQAQNKYLRLKIFPIKSILVLISSLILIQCGFYFKVHKKISAENKVNNILNVDFKNQSIESTGTKVGVFKITVTATLDSIITNFDILSISFYSKKLDLIKVLSNINEKFEKNNFYAEIKDIYLPYEGMNMEMKYQICKNSNCVIQEEKFTIKYSENKTIENHIWNALLSV